MPSSFAPRMSVSIRSPTTTTRAGGLVGDSRYMTGSGLPTAVGRTPVTAVMTSTSAPFAGTSPRSPGTEMSRFVATSRAPRWTAMHASARSRQPSSGPNPTTTTPGPSSAEPTVLAPASRRAVSRPSPPMGSTASSGNSSTTNRAAATADVTTSSACAATPKPRRWSATACGVRDALLVMKVTRTPARRTASITVSAPGTSDRPR